MEDLKKFDSGLVSFSRKVFSDERGFFSEVFREKDNPCSESFVQENISLSRKGVLRGLHIQLDPYAQGKLVTCLKGEIFDVALDLRRGSPSFGKHWVFILRGTGGETVYIPEGFAHGFYTLSEEALLFYKVTSYYKPEAEVVLRWDDPEIGIPWPQEGIQLSQKDLQGLSLHSFSQKNTCFFAR